MKYLGFELDPFQIQSINAIDNGDSVLVGAPTGAGKTVIAEYAVDRALREGKRVVYTAPIKALSNQKFRDFSERHPGKVGLITGDVTYNRDAPLVIMTTEIFRNCIFDSPELVDDVQSLIFDEVHYISDFERGTVWEETIIFAPKHIQVIALSATIPNMKEFASWIAEVRECHVEIVLETHRPVPLEHHLFLPTHGEITLQRLKKIRTPHKKKRFYIEDNKFPYNVIDHVLSERKLPCMVFSFNRALCEKLAKLNIRRKLLKGPQIHEVGILYDELCDKYGVNDMKKRASVREMVTSGIAYHHAGVLPSLKEVIEQLFTKGLLKLLFTTETFALGINMPAAAVIFTSLEKYDGLTFDVMKTRDYLQMAGRSGRRGIDEVGHVYANIDPYDHKTPAVERLLEQRSEAIESRFLLSYSTLLNLIRSVGEKKTLEACDKSFASFQHNGKNRSRIRSEARRRLGLLEEMHYYTPDGLTPRGKLASRLFGYELQVTEFYFAGLFDKFDIHEINMLLMAVSFEARRGQNYNKLPRHIIDPLYKGSDPIIKMIRKKQKKMGIDSRTGRMDFLFSSPTLSWSSGESFEKIKQYTSADDGDIIRCFRLTVQQLRILRHALDGDPGVQEKLAKCARQLNRNEINAEAQLLASLG